MRDRRRVGTGISGAETWTLTVKPWDDHHWMWATYPPHHLAREGAMAESGRTSTRRGAYRLARRAIRDQEARVARRRRREAMSIREGQR